MGPGLLASVLDTIVPADEYPSATTAGALDSLERVAAEDPGAATRIQVVLQAIESAAAATGRPFEALDPDERVAVLDRLADHEDYRWFALLVADGFYADEDNGGNRDGASWRMVGYDPVPVGGWPAPADSRAGRAGRIADRYDVIVVGSGAGGGATACVLAEAGLQVLIIERGDAPAAEALWGDHLRNPRVDAGFTALSGPPAVGNPRVLAPGGLTVWPSDIRWGNNAMTAGGGTRVYGAQAWRFSPEDFRMASTYGVPDGSALADWPIDYDDLEPFYARAERELGVSGVAGVDRWAGPRSTDFPMPALPPTRTSEVLGRGADALGITAGPVPMLVNSVDYGGRPACPRCGACVGFACPVDAKASSLNTVIARAVASGNCDLLLHTRVESLETDARGRVIGVVTRPEAGGPRRIILAAEVALAAGATETARILLNSPTDREPAGVGNATDQVGRHLQAHVYGGAIGLFDEVIADGFGPGVSIGTCDFRHGNPGIVGGGMLANEFVPSPVSVLHYLVSAGFIPLHGLAAKHGMRDYLPRMQRIVGPVQEMTNAESRIRLDPTVTDALGIPVARLSGGVHPEDLKAQAMLGERAQEWLAASGAVRIHRYDVRGLAGPSTGQHQAGTCRMGEDPARSVTDPFGRVWGHDNLRIVDASTHVTNGGVNPVLTIFANSFRIADHMLRGSAAGAA